MTPYHRQKKAVELARRAAMFLREADREFVLCGCARVSETIAIFLRDIGFEAEPIYTFGADPETGCAYEHVWLRVEGREIDPTWWVGRIIRTLCPRPYPSRKSPAWRPSPRQIRGVRTMLFPRRGSWEDINKHVAKLKKAFEEGRLTRPPKVLPSDYSGIRVIVHRTKRRRR